VITVAGKGEIHVALVDSSATTAEGCDVVLNADILFTVNGGSGKYAGATGSGKLAGVLSEGGEGGTVRDTYTGTVDVPGFTFDLTPPAFRGAVSKTVRVAKRSKGVRVAYKITATDDVDGAVPAKCKPASGSRFRLGKTRVTCSASDTSANTATKSFTITVKRKRR
jgi:HYR domain